ncbi:hypothetical protein INR49_013699 [Caranx melampygus]|nr:hypothetical protein INR49_013699 [Caranx melampygus]
MDNLVKVHGGGGYDSDFSDDDEQGEASHRGLKRKSEEEILQKPFQKGRHSQVAHRSSHSNEVDRAKDKTDRDVLRENHRFLWRDEDEDDMTWCSTLVNYSYKLLEYLEKELAKKYYDKLFKEYCIADLSRYKENKFGFRWRTENEVVSGKGVCPECSFKLNYHHKRKEVKAKAKTKKLSEKHQRPPHEKKRKRSSSRSKKHKHKDKHRRHRDHSTSSSSSEGVLNSDKDSEVGDEPEGQSEADHWRGPAPAVEEKSR